MSLFPIEEPCHMDQQQIDIKINDIHKNALFIEDLARIRCGSDSDIADLARVIVLDTNMLMNGSAVQFG